MKKTIFLLMATVTLACQSYSLDKEAHYRLQQVQNLQSHYKLALGSMISSFIGLRLFRGTGAVLGAGLGVLFTQYYGERILKTLEKKLYNKLIYWLFKEF
jgi:hypothetical protein